MAFAKNQLLKMSFPFPEMRWDMLLLGGVLVDIGKFLTSSQKPTFQMQKLSGAEKKHLEGRTELQIPNIQKQLRKNKYPPLDKIWIDFFFLGGGEGDRILLS